jgi:hypothetical protein
MALDPRTVAELRERQWSYHHRRPGETTGSAETSWYLQALFGQRVGALVAGLAQQAGVEARSPLYDRRVIEFVARRPREDRFSRGETKRLLRASMNGLLPAAVLTRRRDRTGVAVEYLRKSRRAALPGWAEVIGAELRLSELGLVRAADLRAAQARYLSTPRWEGTLGGELFNVYSAEFWVRAHGTSASTAAAKVA